LDLDALNFGHSLGYPDPGYQFGSEKPKGIIAKFWQQIISYCFVF